MKIAQATAHTVLLKTSFFLSVAFCLFDTLRYSGFTANNFYLSPLAYALIFAALHLGLRYKTKLHLAEPFALTLLTFVFPLTMTLALGMLAGEAFGAFFPNFFFAEFGVDYRGLASLGITCLLFGLAHSSTSTWSRHAGALNLFLTSGFLASAFFLFLLDPALYKTLTSEDNVIEFLTAFGFVWIGILCLQLRPLLQKHLNYQPLGWLLIIAALGSFLIAGEEISWGQRLLDIATPEAIATVNRQGEINLHNLESVWPFVYTAYLLLGSYGAGLWILRFGSAELLERSMNKAGRIWLDLLVPSGYLVLNFGLIIIYVLLREWYGPWRFVALEEISELLLCIGIVAHLLYNKRSLRQ